MEPKREFMEHFRKITDRFKGRIKKAMKCYWPEPSSYCGCCTLSTGIYIRSVLVIIIITVTMSVNGVLLQYLMNIRQLVYEKNLTVVEEFWDPETDWDTLFIIYNLVVVYHILWISFKIVYILVVMWTIYAVYRKNTKILKILVYLSIPNLFIDVLISIAGAILLDSYIKFMIIICILSEGYNLLAMNSEYKKLAGKSRLVTEDATELDSNTEQIYRNNPVVNQPHTDIRFRSRYDQAHCRTCTCYDIIPEDPPEYTDRTEIVTRVAISSSSETVANLSDSNPNENQSIVNNNNAEQGISQIGDFNEICETATNSGIGYHEVRPNTRNDPFNSITKLKLDLSDDPVIYDEGQLNVGTNPVLKDSNRFCT